MHTKKIALTFGLLLFLSVLQAQKIDSGAVAEFDAAIRDLVLLKNEGDLIPLQRLDTLRVALVGVGLEQGCDFQQILKRYTRVETVMPTAVSNPAAAVGWAKQVRQQYDLIILGINDYDRNTATPAYHQFRMHLQALTREEGALVTVVFGGQRAFKLQPWLEQSTVLVRTPHNSHAHSLAAQLLFGGVGAQGKLQEDLSDAFRRGDGLTSQGGIRLGYSPPAVTGIDGRRLRDSLEAIIREGIEAEAFPGAQVLVAHRGQVVHYEAYGHHTYDSLRQVSTKDLYDYASLTKITSALPALMRLHGQGTFRLDAPLERYFPDVKGSNKADLSFRAMLAHHARLRPWIPYWRGALRGNARYPWRNRWDDEMINRGKFKWWTFKEDSSKRFPIRITEDLWLNRKYKKKIYKAIRKSPLNEEAGYRYSGLLFYLLPEIVSNLSGENYETFLKKTFYHRLGAYTITYNPLRFHDREAIVPTERDTFFRHQLLHGAVHDEGAAMMAGVSANAGLFSTANDLAKLMQLYLNFGHYGNHRYIAESSLREFTRCQYCSEDNWRGLGFDRPRRDYEPESSYIAPSASPQSFGHSGYTGTFAWVDPKEELVFIFFSNRVYPTRLNRKLYEMDIRRRLHEAVYRAVIVNGE